MPHSSSPSFYFYFPLRKEVQGPTVQDTYVCIMIPSIPPCCNMQLYTELLLRLTSLMLLCLCSFGSFFLRLLQNTSSRIYFLCWGIYIQQQFARIFQVSTVNQHCTYLLPSDDPQPETAQNSSSNMEYPHEPVCADYHLCIHSILSFC